MAPLENVSACVFDAYGTLFDVNAAAAHKAEEIGDKWQKLAETWRAKQLQYTWLRGLTGRHVDFWRVTGDALDFALASVALDDPALREDLMALYLRLDAYDEVSGVLHSLKAAGIKLAILSNGSPRMLRAAADHAGITTLFDHILSVEEVGVFKPHPSVYQLAVDRLGLPAGEMSFQSSNGWDAYSAKAFGFRVAWVNRFGQAAERIPDAPDVVVDTLTALPGLIGIA